MKHMEPQQITCIRNRLFGWSLIFAAAAAFFGFSVFHLINGDSSVPVVAPVSDAILGGFAALLLGGKLRQVWGAYKVAKRGSAS